MNTRSAVCKSDSLTKGVQLQLNSTRAFLLPRKPIDTIIHQICNHLIYTSVSCKYFKVLISIIVKFYILVFKNLPEHFRTKSNSFCYTELDWLFRLNASQRSYPF